MAAPQVASSSTEARRNEIDSQAAAMVANSPVVHSHLPPIPPSPFQHRQEVERNEKAAQMVKAAGEGRESRFLDLARELGVSNPNALYSDVRKQFLERREELLVNEAANAALHGNLDAQTYWLGQLANNTVERCRLEGTVPSKAFVDVLSAVSRQIRSAGGPEYASRMESMLSSALEAGFPIRAVLGTAKTFNVSSENSTVIPGETVSKHLNDLAKHYIEAQLAQCATLYAQRESSPGAEMEFRRAYNRLLRMCDELLPPGVGTQDNLATQAGRQRISLDAGFSIDNMYGTGKNYP